MRIFFLVSFFLSTNCEVFPSHPLSIYVIGDLHGDFKNTLTVLRAANVLSTSSVSNGSDGTHTRWIGGRNIVIQMGDIVDRGPDSPLIYKLFKTLGRQAKRHGGEIHHIFGNHETMNLCGDYSSLSKIELKKYFNSDLRNWRRVWSEDGYIGKYVRENFDVVKVLFRRILFVHAGLAPAFARFTPAQLKSAFLHRVDKQHCSIPIDPAAGPPPTTSEELSERGTFDWDIIYGRYSPMWSRVSSEREESVACRYVKEALARASEWSGVEDQQNRSMEFKTNNESLVCTRCPRSEKLEFMIVGHTTVMMALGRYDGSRLDLILRCRCPKSQAASYIMTDAGISRDVANNIKFLEIEVFLGPPRCPPDVRFDFYQIGISSGADGKLVRNRHFLMSTSY